MLASLLTHVYAIKRLDNLFGLYFTHPGNSGISFTAMFAYTIVLIRASSFLSNSYILEEGKVASFLLATTGILQLRYAIVKKKMVLEGLAFILLVPMLKLGIELGQAKQAVNSLFLKFQPSWTLGILRDSQILMHVVEIVPLLGLILLACILYKCIVGGALKGILKYVVSGTIFNYVLIAMIWASDSGLLSFAMVLKAFKGNLIPRIVYASSFLQLLSLVVFQIVSRETSSSQEESTFYKALAMLSSWSSTVILLSGKQGSLVALSSVIAGVPLMAYGMLLHSSDLMNSTSSVKLSFLLLILLAFPTSYQYSDFHYLLHYYFQGNKPSKETICFPYSYVKCI